MEERELMTKIEKTLISVFVNESIVFAMPTCCLWSDHLHGIVTSL